jgi:protein-tyrosine-phosphatase
VLYVCTGNICRSAVAERLLRLRLHERLGNHRTAGTETDAPTDPHAGTDPDDPSDASLFEVESAGAQGLTGHPMDDDSAAALRELGGDETGFSARKLDADQIRRADLILTANRKHRATVVRLDATAAQRTFTIREFASLAEQFDLTSLPDVDAATRLQAVVEEIAASRGTVRPDERSDFDVEDPYGGPPSLHQRIVAQIDAATTMTTDLLVAAVRPEPTSPAPPGDEPSPSILPARSEPARSTRSQRRAKRKRRVRPLWIVLAVVIPVVAVAACAGWVAVTGLSARRELELSRPLVSLVRQQVLDGDTSDATQTVHELQNHTGRARSNTDGPIWGVAGKVPFLGDDVSAVRTTTRAVDDVAQKILPPLVTLSDSIRPDKLRASGNRINLVPLQKAAPALTTSATATAQIKAQVDGIDTQGLTAPVARAVADVRLKINELASTTASAARAAELIPPMLGADGARRYFLAFQNPAEARGTGGLLGAYGVLEADHGRLRVRHLGPNTELTNPKKLPIDLGKDYQALYGRTPPDWVNGNVSPNFPDAGRIWTAMWRQEFHQNLDGVIATDPVALGFMLTATGPATLPGGGQITAANATAVTMRNVYARYPAPSQNTVRDRYLQGVAGAVFGRLLSGQGDPKTLAVQLAKAAGEGRLLVYSAHAKEQQQLEQSSLAGDVPDTARPFAGLVVNNYSGSKLDYYLDRTLVYRRSSCPTADGTSTSSITVTLKNDPPKGLPAYVVLQLDTSGYLGKPPRGANSEYVEVLATRGAQLVGATLDGKELLVTGAQTQGHAVFAFNVALLPGQARTIVLHLTEPTTHGTPELMRPQPLVRAMSQQTSIQPCR